MIVEGIFIAVTVETPTLGFHLHNHQLLQSIIMLDVNIAGGAFDLDGVLAVRLGAILGTNHFAHNFRHET